MPTDHPAIARIPVTFKSKISPKATEILKKVHDWVESECIPSEDLMERQLEGHRWTVQPRMKELRQRAKAAGLFNLFLPKTFQESPGLTNLEYACCAEIMGRCFWAAEVSIIICVLCHCEPNGKNLTPVLDGLPY